MAREDKSIKFMPLQKRIKTLVWFGVFVFASICAFLQSPIVFAQSELERVKLEADGNKLEPTEKLAAMVRDELRAFAGSGFKESYINDAVYTVEKHYKEKGYYFVKIKYEITDGPEPGKKVVHLYIDEGRVVYLKGIRPKDNVAFSNDELNVVLRGFLDVLKGSKPFIESDVDIDRANLEDFYHKRGYIRVSTRMEYKFNDTKEEVIVYIHINEGKKFFVKAIVLNGIEPDSVDYMNSQMKRYEGDPYSPATEEGLTSLLKDLLANKGHPFAAVQAARNINEETGEVVILLDVNMGPLTRIKNIKISGNEKTKDWVVKKFLLFDEGDRFTKWRILDGQKRLINTGYFKSAEVVFEKTDETGENVDVLVNVAEQDMGQLKLRGGYGYYEGFHAGVDLVYDNIDGRGKRIKAGGKISERGLKYDGQFYIPWLGRSELNFTFSPVYERREETSFSFLKTGMEVALSRTVRDKTTGGLGIRVESVSIYDIKASLPTEQDEYQARSLFFDVTRDTRDDIFNPKYGTLWTAGLEYGGHFLNGTIDFYKASFKTSWYKEFNNNLSGAFCLSSGLIVPTGDTKEVPISKRFFLGGENTIRGFKQNMVGPLNKDKLPFGGEVFINGNLEFRPQIWDGLYGAVFFDTGNVWEEPSAFLSTKLRYGAGVGLRFITPVGPFRFDAAENLDRKKNEPKYEFYLSVGFPF